MAKGRGVNEKLSDLNPVDGEMGRFCWGKLARRRFRRDDTGRRTHRRRWTTDATRDVQKRKK